MLTRPHPLARALYWKREALYQSEILDGLGRFPSHERDVAFDAYVDAREQRRSIIQTAWDLRAMSRGYVPVRAVDADLAQLAGVA